MCLCDDIRSRQSKTTICNNFGFFSYFITLEEGKMPRLEFTVTDEDDTKANFFLLGIIGLYFLLVLIAFLCTDGRRKYIIPLLRMCWPSHRLVAKTDEKERKMSKVNSVDQDFRHLNFVIRKAKRDGVIHRWKVKGKVNFVQIYEDESFVEVNHIKDLRNMGIKIPRNTSLAP